MFTNNHDNCDTSKYPGFCNHRMTKMCFLFVYFKDNSIKDVLRGRLYFSFYLGFCHSLSSHQADYCNPQFTDKLPGYWDYCERCLEQ